MSNQQNQKISTAASYFLIFHASFLLQDFFMLSKLWPCISFPRDMILSILLDKHLFFVTTWTGQTARSPKYNSVSFNTFFLKCHSQEILTVATKVF